MKAYLMRNESAEFFLQDNGDKVQLCFFSEFDRDTKETDSISASFEKADMERAFFKLKSEGVMEIADGGNALKIEKKGEAFNISIKTDNHDMNIYDVDLDLTEIEKKMNKA